MRQRILLTLIVSAGLLGAGSSTAGAATITPASHDFGSVRVGSTSPIQTFTVSAGGSSFQVSNLTVSPGDFLLFDDGDASVCGGFLNPGQSCTFGIGFRPLKPGPQTATVTVSGGNGSLTAQLSGTAPPVSSSGGKKKKCKKGHKGAAAAKKCKKK
jgi:hypothetical protein